MKTDTFWTTHKSLRNICILTYVHSSHIPKCVFYITSMARIQNRIPVYAEPFAHHLNRNIRKRNFRYVRPVKIQISLRIRAVWSESSQTHHG